MNEMLKKWALENKVEALLVTLMSLMGWTLIGLRFSTCDLISYTFGSLVAAHVWRVMVDKEILKWRRTCGQLRGELYEADVDGAKHAHAANELGIELSKAEEEMGDAFELIMDHQEEIARLHELREACHKALDRQLKQIKDLEERLYAAEEMLTPAEESRLNTILRVKDGYKVPSKGHKGKTQGKGWK